MTGHTDTPHPLLHYPSTLIDVRIEPDGTRLMLRPVLPQDEDLIADLVARVSAAGRRNRFHGTVNLSRAELHHMSCIDYEHEMAFVVCACKDGVEIVIAEARFCHDPLSANTAHDTSGAEFALMVDDHWQRRGLGRWVMLALRDAAQAAGLTWLHGEVLRDNLPMLALMRDCGLCCTPNAEDDCLVHAQLRMSSVGSEGSTGSGGSKGNEAAHHFAQTQPHSALRWACRALVREVAALCRHAASQPTATSLPTTAPASRSAAHGRSAS